MKNVYRILLAVAMLLGASFTAIAQQSIVFLTDTNQILSPGRFATYLEDKQGNLSIETIQSPENQKLFARVEKDNLKFQKSENWFWVRIDIRNVSSRTDWLLELEEAKFKFADLFFKNGQGQWEEIKNGYALPIEKKYKRHYYQVFPLAFYQDTSIFYLRIKGSLTTAPLKIISTPEFEAKHFYKNILYGLFCGVMLFIAFNNLAFGLLTRSVKYLLYVCLVINYTAVNLIGHGFSEAFIHLEFDLLQLTAIATTSNFTFMLLYAKYFLNVGNTGWVAKTVNVFLVICLLYFVGSFFISPVAAYSSVQLFVLFALLVTVLVSVSSLKREGEFAVYYLLTIVILAGFVFIEISYINTGAPKRFYLSHGSWGALIEVVILAYALNRKFEFERRQLQVAKEKAQQETLSQIQENARLIEEQNELLEEKVKTRTLELHQANDELATTNEELYQTQEEILSQRDQLEHKNNLLEQYTDKIGKSIDAAKMIQKAILPTKAKMQELFGEHFVLFRPKDVVSGDFWWANELEGEKYLIVADCSGHGVPGAMLTMIGSALLDRIIRLMGVREPAEILEKLHQEIKEALQQEQSKNSEGMDLAIIHWHYENDECFITFSAAKRPLWYILDGKIEKIAGTRRIIGGIWRNTRPFETQTLRVPRGTCLYLGSDGYADQNNEGNASFSERHLMELFQEIHDLPLPEQKEMLKSHLMKHMHGVEQRDDILVVGVRV